MTLMKNSHLLFAVGAQRLRSTYMADKMLGSSSHSHTSSIAKS